MTDEPGKGGEGGGEQEDDVFLKKIETNLLSQVKLQGIEGIRKARRGGAAGGHGGRGTAGLSCLVQPGKQEGAALGGSMPARRRLAMLPGSPPSPLPTPSAASTPAQVFLREAKRTRLDPASGGWISDTEWVLDTEGVNLLAVMCHPDVDFRCAPPACLARLPARTPGAARQEGVQGEGGAARQLAPRGRRHPAATSSPCAPPPPAPCPPARRRTVSNDIIEMLQTLGIEAARNALLKELRGAPTAAGLQLLTGVPARPPAAPRALPSCPPSTPRRPPAPACPPTLPPHPAPAPCLPATTAPRRD